MLYPISLALLDWFFSIKLTFVQKKEEPILSKYSQTWVALFLFLLMTIVCQKRDINFYVRIQTYGSLAIVAFIVIIFAQGVHSMTNTDFKAVVHPVNEALWYYSDEALQEETRTFFLVNTHFPPLAAILGISFYLPQMSVPIVRSN